MGGEGTGGERFVVRNAFLVVFVFEEGGEGTLEFFRWVFEGGGEGVEVGVVEQGDCLVFVLSVNAVFLLFFTLDSGLDGGLEFAEGLDEEGSLRVRVTDWLGVGLYVDR